MACENLLARKRVDLHYWVSRAGRPGSPADMLVFPVGRLREVGSWWTWEGMVNLMDGSQC